MTELDDAGGLDEIAAEYVIGTLDAAERTEFAARLSTDEAVRRAVAAWERRLAPLGRSVGEVQPPAELWMRVERALGDNRARRLRVVEGGGARIDAAQVLRSRDRWRLLALSAAGIAAALAAFVVVRAIDLPRPLETAATYVAAVNRGGDKPALIVTVDLKTRQVLVRPVAAQTPAGHSLQLWYIGGGRAPRSMGLVSDAVEKVAIPSGASADGDATFAVSIEPQGGSTTGGPSGAVLYSGQLVKQ